MQKCFAFLLMSRLVPSTPCMLDCCSPSPTHTHTPTHHQFEDPAPGLQLLRERLELEMMDACEWLTQPATAALAAAAAKEELMREGIRPTSAAGSQQQYVLSSPSCLAIPHALQQRITNELKIHKHQVGGVGLMMHWMSQRNNTNTCGLEGVRRAATVLADACNSRHPVHCHSRHHTRTQNPIAMISQN